MSYPFQLITWNSKMPVGAGLRWSCRLLAFALVGTLAAHAQDSSRPATPPAARVQVDPKEFSTWNLTFDLVKDVRAGEEEERFEIRIDSERRCQVDRVGRVSGVDRKQLLMLEGGVLSREDLATVLKEACAAVSKGPPERKSQFANEGWRVRLSLAGSTRTYGFEADRLDALLRNAGAEIQTIVKVVNGRLVGPRIWSREQEQRVPRVDPGDLSRWELSLNLGFDSPEASRLHSWEIAVGSEGRCLVHRIYHKAKTVLFDGELPADELARVLEEGCSAFNNDPPKRKDSYWHDGLRIDVRLTSPERSFVFYRDGLRGSNLESIPEDAGPEIQKIVKLVNGHIREPKKD